MIAAAARDLFFPPGMREARQAAADRETASKVRRLYPAVWDSFVEAKIAACIGSLPEAGGWNDQTGGFASTLEWLAEAGILEWVGRSAPGIG
jgi:hypothetical protein